MSSVKPRGSVFPAGSGLRELQTTTNAGAEAEFLTKASRRGAFLFRSYLTENPPIELEGDLRHILGVPLWLGEFFANLIRRGLYNFIEKKAEGTPDRVLGPHRREAGRLLIVCWT